MSGLFFRSLAYSAILMSTLLLFSSLTPAVLGQSILTERMIYAVGDVILFPLSGLTIGENYNLTIYRGGQVYSIEFNAVYEEMNISWESSSSDPGTYVVMLLDSEDNVISSCTFGLVEINKLEFMPRDQIIIRGGGAEPNSAVNIVILLDSKTLLNVSAIADENGEFDATVQLPFNITTGSYTVEVYVTGGMAPDVSFQVFVNATVSNMMNVTASRLKSLIDLLSGMNLTIGQSLLAKLQNSLKKIEQAEEHLLANQTHVAGNMLNAAGNILNALLNEVRAQSGKNLDNDTAAYMNSTIREAIKELEMAQSKLDKHPGKDMNVNKSAAEEMSDKDKSHGKSDESRGNNGAAKESNGKRNGGKGRH